MPDSFSVCAVRIVAETHMKDLGYCSDKSSGRLNDSDDFHAAIWTVVTLKVNSLLVLIGVASIAYVVRFKNKTGETHLPTTKVMALLQRECCSWAGQE